MAQPVALVTGGAVRLGRAIALGLAEAGYDLMISYNSSAGPARELAGVVEGMGRRCTAVQVDLGDERGAGVLLDALARAHPRLDVLVNSAASFQAGALVDVDAVAWDAVMDLNVRAPHLVVREAAPLLSEARGCVVNMVDLSALQPWTAYPAHAVSKAALTHLTRVQARALAPEIRVNAVAPGAVLPPEDESEESLERLRRLAPLGTLGNPRDVVRAVLYLVNAPFVTGQIMAVDGGRSIVPF